MKRKGEVNYNMPWRVGGWKKTTNVAIGPAHCCICDENIDRKNEEYLVRLLTHRPLRREYCHTECWFIREKLKQK